MNISSPSWIGVVVTSTIDCMIADLENYYFSLKKELVDILIVSKHTCQKSRTKLAVWHINLGWISVVLQGNKIVRQYQYWQKNQRESKNRVGMGVGVGWKSSGKMLINVDLNFRLLSPEWHWVFFLMERGLKNGLKK